MSSLTDAVDVLYEVLRTVDGVQPYRGLGLTIHPPATAVGPPKLQRRLRGSDPSDATFQVAVIVAKNERAMDELMRLEPMVAAAIDALPQVAVGDSNPGVWPSGGVDLPCYLIDVDYAL